ncbi:MAG: WYL domain-containing protein [Pseudobutyrivibrio sp.]|uniref:helix-turn-helix transcriptional regulator n=1 Tax=Pseudobutyrivibrio sp. TaxID=2014367 RepID=UPI0025E2B4F5|nr:WYL domain-containing protein [Pseudobutyrivibrio sp.]MBQ6462214.1 WYL domain-containing protein [Pseudobutyrivibrio sp.]
MAKGSNQKLKLSYLCKILLEKTDDEHSLTLAQIMNELEKYDISAERKSLYNDFLVMKESLDMDVIKEQIGRETYYHIGERDFQLAEVKLLIDSIQASKFISKRKSNDLIKKMKSLVSEHQAKQLQRQVYVNDRIKSMNEGTYYTVDAIHNAIAENKQIEFVYCSWTIEKKLEPRRDGSIYRVSPWALTWANENYYLVAFDATVEKVKHYRVDKMVKLNILKERRLGEEYFKNFNMGTYALENFSMFGGEIKRVHIEFPNNKVGIFIDRFGKDILIRPEGQERSSIAVDVAISNQFFGWIFGLGSDVKVTKPDDVIEKIKIAANDFMSNY